MAPVTGIGPRTTGYQTKPAPRVLRGDAEEEKPKSGVETKQVQQARLAHAERAVSEKAISTATGTQKPVAEFTMASAYANMPLFQMSKTSEALGAALAVFNHPNGMATVSGLTETKKGSQSGDKKEGKKEFAAAHKDLIDTRYEATERILGGNLNFMA